MSRVVDALMAEYEQINSKLYLFARTDGYSKIRISRLMMLLSKIEHVKETKSYGDIDQKETIELEGKIRSDIRRSTGKSFRKSHLFKLRKSVQSFW